MKFDEYCKIMKEHGIGELHFLYHDKECYIWMETSNFSFIYEVRLDGERYYSDCFEDIISYKYLSIGKNLEEIWDEIEILSIDGVAVIDYNAQTCSYNYVEYLKQQGELQWSCFLSTKQSFLFQLKYVMLGGSILLLLSVLLPLFNLSNWKILFLSGGCTIFALIIAVIALIRNKLSINYAITTKNIFIFNGLALRTTYDNIKKVKIKKNILKKGYGTIKLKVKKGLSLNYQLANIPEVEKVYNLIIDNMKRN